MRWKNQFLEAGFPPDEATIWALRSDLARLLRQYMERQPSQTAAARRLGISQSMVSNIRGGRLDKISLERLIRLMVVAEIPGTAQWSGDPDCARAIAGTWIDEAADTAGQVDTQRLSVDIDDSMMEWMLAADDSLAATSTRK